MQQGRWRRAPHVTLASPGKAPGNERGRRARTARGSFSIISPDPGGRRAATERPVVDQQEQYGIGHHVRLAHECERVSHTHQAVAPREPWAR